MAMSFAENELGKQTRLLADALRNKTKLETVALRGNCSTGQADTQSTSLAVTDAHDTAADNHMDKKSVTDLAGVFPTCPKLTDVDLSSTL